MGIILGLRVLGGGELGVGSDVEVIEGVGVRIYCGEVLGGSSLRLPLSKSRIVPSVADFRTDFRPISWAFFDDLWNRGRCSQHAEGFLVGSRVGNTN
jgi:hypothetical protein